ncbi:hypothetical protein EYB31_20935 [Paenibacillus thalictri]|uniref:DUF5668 domain-containing protein n=2 Tax=Paenibacillus thalictri TaxID=2527873 RepID=A0A4Q9DLV8_9BACL|nr:hypothetical protein EYB31_20935 [Paenibacillus thalictri]
MGVLLIIAGIFLYATRGNAMDPGNVFVYFWPSIFVIPMGILLHWMYFYMTGRRGSGMLIPGGILIVSGIVCQISMLFDVWEYTWPGFPLAVAFGLLEFYWFGGRNRWILIPVFILGSMAIIFFAIFTLGAIFSFGFVGQTTVAITLVAAGIAFLFSKREDRSEV